MTSHALPPILYAVKKTLFLLMIMAVSPGFAQKDEAPEPSVHPTFRSGVSGGYGEYGAIVGLEFRGMLHDLMDTGHNARHYGVGEIGNVRLSWQSRPGRVRFDELTLVHLGGFPPRDTEEEKEWSYFLKVGGSTVRDSSCVKCLAGTIEGGWGASLSLGEDSPLLLFGLISADVGLAAGFSDFVRVGAGPHAGIRLNFLRHFVLMAEGYYRYRLGGYHHGHYGRGELRWNLSRTFSLWARGERFPDGWEGRIGTFFYF